MEEFLIEARNLAYSESEKTGTPVKLHIDLATEAGKRLAGELGANVEIVEAGTLLMDCALGEALKENKQKEHVRMSLEKANNLMDKYSLAEIDKENIRNCILQHHGAKEFYSLESEICCNADCYRFVSIQGFIFAVRYLREMPFDYLVNKLNEKVVEKWKNITLTRVRDELMADYSMILDILKKISE